MEQKLKRKNQYAYDTGLRLVLDFGFFKRHGMKGMLRLANHEQGDFMDGLLDGAAQVVKQDRGNKSKSIPINEDWTIDNARRSESRKTELNETRKGSENNNHPNKTGRTLTHKEQEYGRTQNEEELERDAQQDIQNRIDPIIRKPVSDCTVQGRMKELENIRQNAEGKEQERSRSD